MTEQAINLLTLEQLQELCQYPDRILQQLCPLLETLACEDEELRAWASDCLQQSPDLDDEQAAAVAVYCQHENPFVANWACAVLAKATHLDAFQHSLVQALRSHSNIGVKQSAAATLAGLKSAELATREALEHAAQNGDARLQRLANSALKKLN